SVKRHTPAPLSRLLVLGLLVCAATIIASSSASAASRPRFGFNEFNDASNYSLQPQLGMPVRRMLMGWNTVQRRPGSWDWSQSDAVYSAIRAHGLKPLIAVQSAPCAANTTPPCR